MNNDRLQHILVFLTVVMVLFVSRWFTAPAPAQQMAEKNTPIEKETPPIFLLSTNSPAEDPGTSGPSDDGLAVSEELPHDLPLPKSVEKALPELSAANSRAAAKREKPASGASIALAVDIGSGRMLYSESSDRRWPMASLTKLMTAIIATDSYSSEDTIQADFDPAPLVGTGGAGTVSPGEKFSVRDLLGMTLVSSSNEAAEALAANYPGGRAAFIAAMNAQAKEWGLENTNYGDPTGLSVVNQSTPSDLERLVVKIYAEYPDILDITRKRTWTATELTTRRKRTVTTTNSFAGQADFLGGKTGYTDDAGGNLISLFSLNRSPVFILVMGAEDRFGATREIVNWLKERNRIGG